ncbi:hypothetical protein D3C71_607250 [compost metagenome]
MDFGRIYEIGKDFFREDDAALEAAFVRYDRVVSGFLNLLDEMLERHPTPTAEQWTRFRAFEVVLSGKSTLKDHAVFAKQIREAMESRAKGNPVDPKADIVGYRDFARELLAVQRLYFGVAAP